MYGRAGAGRPYGSRFGIATRRIVAAIASTAATGRCPLATPNTWVGSPSTSRRTIAGRRSHRQRHGRRAVLHEVDGDLGAGVSGTDDQHPAAAERLPVPVAPRSARAPVRARPASRGRTATLLYPAATTTRSARCSPSDVCRDPAVVGGVDRAHLDAAADLHAGGMRRRRAGSPRPCPARATGRRSGESAGRGGPTASARCAGGGGRSARPTARPPRGARGPRPAALRPAASRRLRGRPDRHRSRGPRDSHSAQQGCGCQRPSARAGALKPPVVRAERGEVRIGLRERLLPVVTLGVLAALLPAAVLVLLRDVDREPHRRGALLLGRVQRVRRCRGRARPDRGRRAPLRHADGAGRDRVCRDGEPARPARPLHARRVVRQQRCRRDHRRRDPAGRRGAPHALDPSVAACPAEHPFAADPARACCSSS